MNFSINIKQKILLIVYIPLLAFLIYQKIGYRNVLLTEYLGCNQLNLNSKFNNDVLDISEMLNFINSVNLNIPNNINIDTIKDVYIIDNKIITHIEDNSINKIVVFDIQNGDFLIQILNPENNQNFSSIIKLTPGLNRKQFIVNTNSESYIFNSNGEFFKQWTKPDSTFNLYASNNRYYSIGIHKQNPVFVAYNSDLEKIISYKIKQQQPTTCFFNTFSNKIYYSIKNDDYIYQYFFNQKQLKIKYEINYKNVKYNNDTTNTVAQCIFNGHYQQFVNWVILGFEIYNNNQLTYPNLEYAYNVQNNKLKILDRTKIDIRDLYQKKEYNQSLTYCIIPKKNGNNNFEIDFYKIIE